MRRFHGMATLRRVGQGMGRGLLLLMAGLTLGTGGAHAATTVTVTLVMTDAQGNVLMTKDVHGNILARYTYRPYGTQQSGPTNHGPGYTGHVNDPATGLVYMQQRYYDPEVGRFISPDPVGPTPGNIFNFGRYTYANDNPVRFTDPNGRQSVGQMIDAGAQGCGLVSCAGWAVLHAAWSMTGAEPLSQVADKGWSNASTADKVGAVAAVAAVVPVGRVASAVVRGGAKAVRVGQAGEAAVRSAVDIGEKISIKVGTRTRIPDGLTKGVLSEVKNVKSLSYTKQLRDFTQFSQDKGLRFDLYVRPGAKISGPLQDAIDRGLINRLDIPQ